MNIIFLDVDGVLNNKRTTEEIDGYVGIDDYLVSRLATIIKSTNSKVVLISSWRYNWNRFHKTAQDECANYLDQKMLKYNIHIDDKIDNSLSKGLGIIDYLGKFKEYKFVIIDDEENDYEELGMLLNFVQTSSTYGLTEKNAIDAINILKRE